MAAFIGGVEGQGATRVTRQGSAKSGITATVQSYDGSIGTRLESVGGVVWAHITVAHDSTSHPALTIYHGPLDDLLTPAGRIALLRAAVTEPLRGPFEEVHDAMDRRAEMAA